MDYHLPSPLLLPEGLSNAELEKLARLGTVEAFDQLRQALHAHEKTLAKIQQSKTGRNALVSAQRKRVRYIQQLLDFRREVCPHEKRV